MKKFSEKIQFTESLGQSDVFESPMYRHYRLSSYHRAKDTGLYDVNRLVEEQKEHLLRSAQEFLSGDSGQDRRLHWTNILIEKSKGLFWHLRIKTGYGSDVEYEVMVMGPDPKRVGEELTEIWERYRLKTDEDFPGFFLLGSQERRFGRDEFERVPLRENCLQSDRELDLHYGSGFSTWSKRFVDGMSEPGLSILRGEPGTGKTSYLRHVIASLISSHRFYYLPTESVDLLSSNQLPELWKHENQKFPHAKKVLVVEDAENILMEREQYLGTRVSSLLNLTDGFMGDLIQVHIVCTLNCEIAALDDAVLRPGRQKFFRDFQSLAYEDAVCLATHLGKALREERSYTLAELYHLKDVEAGELLKKSRAGTVGFARDSP